MRGETNEVSEFVSDVITIYTIAVLLQMLTCACVYRHTHTHLYRLSLAKSLKYFMLLLYNKIDVYMLFIRPHDNFKKVQQKKYGAVHGDIMFFYNPTRHI